MSKKFLILIILITALIIMGIFYFLYKNSQAKPGEIFELKRGESKTIFGLTLQNKSGGHAVLSDGQDEPYADIELRAAEKTEAVQALKSEQKLWNGYLIIFEDVGWDGEYIKFSVKKTGEPKITEDKAFELANDYSLNELKISEEELSEMQQGLSDMGGYYFVNLYKPESKEGQGIFLRVDKFTGQVSQDKQQ